MSEEDLDYYRKRMRKEERRAEQADSLEVRATHRRFARLYAERIRTSSAATMVERDTGAPRTESHSPSHAIVGH